MSSPLFRWVVQAPQALSELLSIQGLVQALPEGRVFVDGQRATEARELTAGAAVEVFAQRPPASIQVLQAIDDVVAVYKPAALPTEPDRTGTDCVLSQLAVLLGTPAARLFALSRLDVGVSGVLLVAASESSRLRLLSERARGTLRRRYVALACGVPSPEQGEWRDAVGRGSAGRRSVAGRDARQAETHYRVVATARPVAGDKPATSLLALSPQTGRTHQLRLHASAHGAPLLGDRRYAGPARMTGTDGSVRSFSQVMLHAAWVEWGANAARQRVASEACADLLETWLLLGGESTALQRALEP